MFAFKQWWWRKWQTLRGADLAYAKYLAHFQHYQTQVVDSELQQSLQLSPMSKEQFLQVWQQKTLKPTGKSCGCKPGCCG